MKKIYSIVTGILLTASVWSQAPQKMSYQAVIRNTNNTLVTSKVIGMRISILKGSSVGTEVYAETQTSTIATNANGLVSIEIGTGTPVTGTFVGIKWAEGPYFIKTETDPTGGTNYTIVGTSELLSIPYALHAKTAENLSGINTGDQDLSGLATSSTVTSSLATKVDKVTGKGLSTNDYTTVEKSKLAAISGTNTGDQDLSGLATTTTVTSSLSTKVDKVTGKGLSTNDYTTVEKTKLVAITGTNTGDQDLSGLATISSVNTSLSTKVDKVNGKGLSTNDYTTVEQNKLAAITGTNTGDQDLSGYATISTVTSDLSTKVDKETGKGLSTNDYTTVEQTKLAAITGTNTGDQDLSGLATTTTVNASLSTKVDKETGKALSTNDYTTVEQTKLAAITGTNTGNQDLSGLATTTTVNASLSTKVDKETGKGLSSNDYTTAEKSKLTAITGTNTGNQDLSGLATTTSVNTSLALKVDKVTGKDLSTNDYTTVEKTKLAAITGTNTGDQVLSGYATISSVNTSLALKVDKVTGKGLQADGTVTGQMEYWNGSAWVAVSPGLTGQTLTFVNGVPVWVGISNVVLNPTTGKIWMDRNLGATQVATSSTDAASYGDLYQWGRGADGHQLRTSTTTATLSSTDVPGNANFILSPNSPYDWLSTQNNNLWQGVNGVNNPCPSGYRIPTETELNAEIVSWSANNPIGAFASPLKLPSAGNRNPSDGLFYDVSVRGSYWSSTIDGTNSRRLHFYNGGAYVGSNRRAYGFSVRCIKE